MSLGIILTPYGKIPGAYPSAINYSYGGRGQFLCPTDPHFHTRGEDGFYYDTPLGGFLGETVPFKVRLATWWENVKAKLKGQPAPVPAPVPAPEPEAVPEPAYEPHYYPVPTDFNMSQMLQYTPVTRAWVVSKEAYRPAPWLPPNGWNQAGAFGPGPAWRQDESLNGFGQATAEDAIRALHAHNQRIFALTFVSTAAVATAALLGAYRTVRLLRERK